MSKRYLIEGSRDNMLLVYLPYFEKVGIDMSLSKLKQFLLNKFVTEAGIHKLSESSNYYLAGVARYYFNGDLTSNKQLNAFNPDIKDEFNSDICVRLDALIGILRLAYIDSVGTKFEQPEDFGELSLKKLLRKYNKKINLELGIDVQTDKEVEKKEYNHSVGNGYTYDILYSYEDAKKYYKYTEPGAWCITYGQQHYNAYVRRLGIHYVIFLLNGYENIERKIGDGFSKQKPHDLYGNSMIAVLQSNTDGEPVYITSRWNHGSYVDGTQGTEADHAYTKEEFLRIIGDDGSVLKRAFQEWKENKPKTTSADRKQLYQDRLSVMRVFKVAQMRINNGADPFSVFKELSPDSIVNTVISNGKPKKGIYYVTLKYNGVGYGTVMDNGVLHFDEFLLNDSYYVARYTVEQGSKFFFIQSTSTNSSYVYDILHHSLLTIDGISKIQAHDTFFRDVPYMLLAARGNQISLVNTDKMVTVKNKDGNSWFESIIPLNDIHYSSNIDYSGRIRLRTYARSGVYLLTYDSSADEKYLYSVKNNSFIDDEINDGNEVLTLSLDSCKLINSDSYFNDYAGYTDIDGMIALRNINDGKFLNIFGEDRFSAISAVDCILAFKNDDDVYKFYNAKTNELLNINGKLLTVDANIVGGRVMFSSNLYGLRGYVYIKVRRENNYWWNGLMIYNTLTNSFFHTDDEGYVFKLYSERAFYKHGNRDEGYVNLPECSKMEEWMNSQKMLASNESKRRRKVIIPESYLLRLRGLLEEKQQEL